MISLINREYIYEKVNNSFCKAHDCKRRSVVGKSLVDVWGKETFQNQIKNKIDSCLSGKTVRYRAVFSTPKADAKTYNVVFRPIKSEGGVVTHIFADTTIISNPEDHQKSTPEIHNRLSILENDFKHRLQQANQLETIGLLTSGIVHDFNNIIATISGYAELIHDELSEGSPLSEKTEKILAASNRAKLLSEQILNISNSDSREKSIVNVNSILRETLDLIRSFPAPGIKISFKITDDELKVFADPTQLLRVFLNLAINSLQAMNDTGGSLEIKTRTLPGKIAKSFLQKDFLADEYILITFRDSGSGINKAHLNHIFEPFYTAGEISKGSGLGLSIVLGIIDEMKGEILVSSRKNKGTLFSIYLPACCN